jgi:hypothetical protein
MALGAGGDGASVRPDEVLALVWRGGEGIRLVAWTSPSLGRPPGQPDIADRAAVAGYPSELHG